MTLACIALAVLAGAALRNERAPPRIESVPVPGDAALTLRFAVSNPGFLTTYRNMDFTCVPDVVTGRNATGAKITVRGAAFPLNVDLDLGPRASFQYTCPIQGAHLPARVDRIAAHVEAAYDSFARRPHAHSPEFLWDSQSKVWVVAPS